MSASKSHNELSNYSTTEKGSLVEFFDIEIEYDLQFFEFQFLRVEERYEQCLHVIHGINLPDFPPTLNEGLRDNCRFMQQE